MSSKQNHNPEILYTNLKKEYNELLQKNQNDLIKIKMREKQLNDTISHYQIQNQNLKQQLTALKDKINNKNPVIKSIDGGSNSEGQVKQLSSRLQQKNQQIQALKKTVADLISKNDQSAESERKLRESLIRNDQELKGAHHQIKQLKRQMESHKIQMQKKLDEQIENQKKLMNQEKSLKEVEFQQKTNMVNKYEKSIEQLKMWYSKEQQSTKQLQNQLKQLQRSYSILQQEFTQSKIKNQQLQTKSCDRCKDLQQKLELHEQMLKSVKMMLKFKEMQLDKYKK